MTFGQRLRELLDQRRISQRALAKEVNCDAGYLSKIVNGHKQPSPRLAELLDQALNAKGTLLRQIPPPEQNRRTVPAAPADPLLLAHPAPGPGQAPAWPGGPLGGPYDTLMAAMSVPGESEEEDPTKRRRLLHLAAGTAVGAVGTAGLHETARHLLELSLSTHRSVEDWNLAIADHLHALRTRPPHQVACDLAIEVHALQAQINRPHPADETRELYRVAAALACVQANALTRLGDHGAAIRWWHTARTAADTSGDCDVRLLVRGEEAIHGLYGQRDPGTILALIGKARDVSRRPWPRLVAAEAKTLAMLGRHREALAALRRLDGLVERGIGGDSLGWWKPDQISFAHSWVHAAAGDQSAADTARDHVLRITPGHSYQYRINARLHESLCTAAQGGTDTACTQALELITSLPAAYRTSHVLHTGWRVLDALPVDQRARPAAADLRTALTTPA